MIYGNPRSAEFNPPQIPPRVQAALQFIQWYSTPLNYGPCMSGDTPRSEPDRNAKETAAYNAALLVVQMYFSGEMDYGDCAPTCAPPQDDDPQTPVPEPVS